MDGGFSFLIVVILIRDNWKAVIENYHTSLICEIWFDLQDKKLLGNILLFLLVRFDFIGNYPTFLIGEIWFDLQDKQLLGNILLSLLVRFGLIYRI